MVFPSGRVVLIVRGPTKVALPKTEASWFGDSFIHMETTYDIQLISGVLEEPGRSRFLNFDEYLLLENALLSNSDELNSIRN